MGEAGNPLEVAIATYESHLEELQERYPEDHWVLIRETEILGVFESFEAADAAAGERCGMKPYLLRQVKAIPLMLPTRLVVSESLLA